MSFLSYPPPPVNRDPFDFGQPDFEPRATPLPSSTSDLDSDTEYPDPSGGIPGLENQRAIAHEQDNDQIRRPEGQPSPEDALGTASKDSKATDEPSAKKLVTKLYRASPDQFGSRKWVKKYPREILDDEKGDRSAITLRFQKNEDDLAEKLLILHSITIRSKELKKLLQEVFQGYPSFAHELQRGRFQSPFTEFVHRWRALRDRAKISIGTRLGEEIEALCDALREELDGKSNEFNEMAEQNAVTWNLLDYLYEPGTTIITRAHDIDQARRVTSTSFDVSGNTPYFKIEAEYIDFNGKHYGTRSASITVDTFKGSRAITSLPAVPLNRMSHAKDFEDKLCNRGRRVMELNRAEYMQYSGFIRTESQSPFGGSYGKFVEGRIIIDADGYSKFQHKIGVKALDDELLSESDGNLASDALVLLTPYVRGYDLTSKQWALFEADKISDITWSPFAFDRLVLSQDRKTLIKALVDSNPSYKGKMDDIIPGKGQGLVILLNGPPGTGKTLTAEAIAEHLQIPIYAATAGELDTFYVDRLEQDLSKILELSARWGAVLLLDEADAFLETRSDFDGQRNKRVAVFLRLLEYYKGVLILTTNRPVTFDPAFHSRIHLTLHYEQLDEAARAEVWKTFLISSVLTEDDYKHLGKLNLNGRRIKNVVKMAQLLAQSQNTELRMAHLDHVLGVAMHGELSFAPEQT